MNKRLFRPSLQTMFQICLTSHQMHSMVEALLWDLEYQESALG